MVRILVTCCFVLAGCERASRSPLPTASVPIKAPEPESAPFEMPKVGNPNWTPTIVDAISGDDSDWKSVTDEPILVKVENSLACAAQSSPDEHGPHYAPSIVVRINREAFDAFRSRQFPMPVGTVIVKEKFPSWEAIGPPDAIGAMIKREPGYDPDNGDWEYVYAKNSPDAKVERGRLANCIGCHSSYAKGEDYLFRTYSWMWEPSN